MWISFIHYYLLIETFVSHLSSWFKNLCFSVILLTYFLWKAYDTIMYVGSCRTVGWIWNIYKEFSNPFSITAHLSLKMAYDAERLYTHWWDFIWHSVMQLEYEMSSPLPPLHIWKSFLLAHKVYLVLTQMSRLSRDSVCSRLTPFICWIWGGGKWRMGEWGSIKAYIFVFQSHRFTKWSTVIW